MQQSSASTAPISAGTFGSGLHPVGSASGIGRGTPTHALGGGSANLMAGLGSGGGNSNAVATNAHPIGSSSGGLSQMDAAGLRFMLGSPAPGASSNTGTANPLNNNALLQSLTGAGSQSATSLGGAATFAGGANAAGGHQTALNLANAHAANPTAYPQRLANSEESIYSLVMELYNPPSREQVLSELSKKRDQFEDLALVLWNSYGVMAIILQEIISVYPLLHSSALSVQASNRVCNALALLQLVAAHPDTRLALIHANIPQYLYPFLSSTSKSKPYDNLRLTSLGVIGAIVKNDSPEIIHFFLQTEFLPLCLKIMEIGSELCKVVATFIFHKILSDDGGLMFMTDHPHRFYIVQLVLSNMIDQLVEATSPRLLKIIVRCYLRLADDRRAREELRQHLPEPLRNTTFFNVSDDPTLKRYFAQLLLKLSDNVTPS
ncbi:RNA-binding protein, CCR4-NOT complex subunit Rcd1 [Dimargaris xerosporica]|nr:RNA-binding protein, CCR4-NOT complex subunit Rcd1 [Dimargaris xerosporica]